MSDVLHHAFVVTSWKPCDIDAARRKAVDLGLKVSDVINSQYNGYKSFLVGPDGSKEGWEPSIEGDTKRHAFRAWLNEQKYEDKSTSLEWVEVSYSNMGASKVIPKSSKK